MTEPLTMAQGTPNLNKALAAFQAEMPSLARDRSVEVETKGDKPNYGYSYATLANVTATAMPLLGKHGLSFTAFPGAGSDGKGMSLHYSLLHESGEERSGEFPMSAEGGIQILGGRITYIRRYCLLAVTGLAAEEDDDAAAAQDYDANKGTAQRRAQPPANRARRAAPTAEPAEGGQTAQRAVRPAVEAPPLPDEGEPHRGRGGLITQPMTSKLAIVMNEVVGTSSADHKQFIADMIGREVATRKDLTFDEGRGLIDAFEKAKTTDNPIGNVIDIYRRTTGGNDLARQDADGPIGEPVRDRPETSGRQPGQRSRNAAEAIGNGGDEGAQPAPWEGELPV